MYLLVHRGCNVKHLQIHGFNVGNGKFIFKEKENIDKDTKLRMDLKLAERIKIYDSYFYETYNIPIPKNNEQ